MLRPSRRRPTDLRQFLWPGACSLCLHLLLAASLAAEWRHQPEVVWVSDIQMAEPVQSDTPDTELAQEEPSASAMSDAEEPSGTEEDREQRSDAYHRSEQATPDITEIPPAEPSRAVAQKIKSMEHPSPGLPTAPATATVAQAAQSQPLTHYSSASLPARPRQENAAAEKAAALKAAAEKAAAEKAAALKAAAETAAAQQAAAERAAALKAAAEKAAAEQAAAEKAAAQRAAAERAAALKAAAEKAAALKAAAEKAVAEQAAAEKAAAQRAAAERAAALKAAAEKAAALKAAAEKAAAEQAAAEKAAAQRAAAERAAALKAAAEKAAALKAAAEKAAAEQAAAEKAAAQRAAAERAAALKAAAEKAATLKAAAEQAAAEKAAAQRAAAERAAALKAAAEKAAALKAAAEKAAAEQAAAEKVAVQRAAAERAAALKAAAENAAAEQAAAEKIAAQRAAAVRAAALKVAAEKAAAERAAAQQAARRSDPVAPRPVPASPPASGSPKALLVASRSLPLHGLVENVPQAAAAPARPVGEDSARKSAVPHRQPMPVFEAPLKGDLELELSGKEVAAQGMKIQVLWCDYPEKRHKKPLSKVERKRVKAMAPKTLRTGVSTLQAVLESAPDGIYTFIGTPESGHSQEVGCVVTFHGTSSRRSVKRLAPRKIASDGHIVKVLMPEGIVWEDDTSFSGSIEDSDGITKYNSDSGLVWKEYQ